MSIDSGKVLTVAGQAFHMRVLTSADVFALVPLEEEVFPQEAWSESLLLEELTRHDRYYLGVFTPAQELVAYAGVRVGQDTDLMTIGVAPHWQGRGLGRALLVELLSAVQTMVILNAGHWYLPAPETSHRGCALSFRPAASLANTAQLPEAGTGTGIAPSERTVERIVLEVRASNTSAQHLYHRVGFVAVGKIARYYRHPLEDAVVMVVEDFPNWCALSAVAD